MFNPKSVPVEEAIARRLITEFCEAHRARTETNATSKRTAVATARLAGACEVAALVVNSPTPFAVHMDVTEAIQSHPACTGGPAAYPTERKAAVEAATTALLAKWGVVEHTGDANARHTAAVSPPLSTSVPGTGTSLLPHPGAQA